MITRNREPETVKDIADDLERNITLRTDKDGLMWFNPRTSNNHNLYVEQDDGTDSIVFTVCPEVEFSANPEWSDNRGRLTVEIKLYDSFGDEIMSEQITEQYIENQGMENIVFMNRINWSDKLQAVADDMAQYAESHIVD